MRLTSAAWWRRLPAWLGVPWKSGTLLIALIAATGVPAFLLVVAEAWQTAAQDAIAAQVANDADLDRSGVDIRVDARFDLETITRADELVRAELATLPATTDPDLTIYTLPANAQPANAEPTDAARVIGTPLRIAAQDGLLDELQIVASTDRPREGLWISAWFAERFGLVIGDELRFVDDIGFGETAWSITAIYETIWSEEGPPPDGPWSSLPTETLPRFLRPLQAPSAALAFADLDVLADSGLTGFLRWRTRSTGLPPTLTGLEDLGDAYRTVETALVTAGPVGDALRSAGAGAGGNPSFDTDLYATVDQAVDASTSVDAPLRATLALGLALAMGVAAATGAFIVERRRAEFRLLAGEGDGSLRLGGRVALQAVAPALIGLGFAVGGGLLVARVFGPGQAWPTDSIPLANAAACSVAAVVGIGAVAGWAGRRALLVPDAAPRTHAMGAALAVAAAATGWLWVQTTGQRGDRVDLASVSLPLAGFATAGLAALALAALVLHRLPKPSAAARPTLLLGIRRVQAGALPLRLTALAIGLGFGLIITSITLVRTLDRAVEAKLATEVGAETRWTLTATDDVAGLVLPARTTVLYQQDTRTTPGDQPTRVVAVDPDTLGDPIAWPHAFGLEPGFVAELLEGDDDAFVPAIAIVGEPTPDEGAFGALQPFPYRVVARAEALPLAGEFGATILVSADAIDELSRRFHDELVRTDEDLARSTTVLFTPATDRFRAHVVSDLSPARLRQALPELEPREEIGATERRTDPDLVGVRLGFEFVRVVGATGLVLAFAALLLQVAARRRTRALSSVMARSLGVPARSIVAATGIEIAVVVAATVGATALAAPPVVGQLAQRFDPLPRLPPHVTTDISPATIAVLAAAVVVATAGAAAVVERRDLRRSPAEVARDAG